MCYTTVCLKNLSKVTKETKEREVSLAEQLAREKGAGDRGVEDTLWPARRKSVRSPACLPACLLGARTELMAEGRNASQTILFPRWYTAKRS